MRAQRKVDQDSHLSLVGPSSTINEDASPRWRSFANRRRCASCMKSETDEEAEALKADLSIAAKTTRCYAEDNDSKECLVQKEE